MTRHLRIPALIAAFGCIATPVMKLHGDSKSENVIIRDNAFWNGSPGDDSPLVADPMLQRDADGDRLLRLSAKSPA